MREITLFRSEITIPCGQVEFAATPAGLCAAGFDGADGWLERTLARRFGPEARLEAGDPHGAGLALQRWLAGELEALDAVPVDAGGTDFQQAVWAHLRRIRPGTTTTYGEIAAALDRRGAERAVGAANGANPIAIFVPCHRVIGRDGSLTGYAGGLARKRWLLEHEGALLL